jgi:hypothetical protein
MANLTSLLYPISSAVTSLPGNLVNTVNSIYGSVYWQQWNAFSQTTTPALTSIILRTDQTFIASINGVSFAPYDQYLQIWNDGGPYSHNTVLISTQIIKSNENFNFEFVRGLACNGAWIVTSTTPLAYTQGNNDVFATVTYISI